MIIQTEIPPEAFYGAAAELTARQQAAFEAYGEAVCGWSRFAANLPEDPSTTHKQRIQDDFDQILDTSFTNQDRSNLSTAAMAAVAFRGAEDYLNQCIFTLESGLSDMPPIQTAEDVRVLDRKYRHSIFNIAKLFVQDA